MFASSRWSGGNWRTPSPTWFFLYWASRQNLGWKRESLGTKWWNFKKSSGKIIRRTKQLGNRRVILWSIILIFSSKYQSNGLSKSLFLIPFPTLGTHMKSRDEILFKGGRVVTPLVLRPKQIIKLYYEHHVYVIMHVIECVDKFLVT